MPALHTRPASSVGGWDVVDLELLADGSVDGGDDDYHSVDPGSPRTVEAPPEEEPVVDVVPGVSEVAAVVPGDPATVVPGVSNVAAVVAVVPVVSEVAAVVPVVSGGPQRFVIHSDPTPSVAPPEDDDVEEAIRVPDRITIETTSSAVSRGRYHVGASPAGHPEILEPQLREVGRIFLRWFRVYPLADPPGAVSQLDRMC